MWKKENKFLKNNKGFDSARALNSSINSAPVHEPKIHIRLVALEFLWAALF